MSMRDAGETRPIETAIVRRVRQRWIGWRWAGVTLAVFFAGLSVVVVMVRPSIVQQPFGLTETVRATVADLRLDRESARPSGSRWAVDLTWTGSDGTPRSGTGQLRDPAPPFQVGDQVQVEVTESGDVSFRPDDDARGVLALVVLLPVAGVGAGTWLWLLAARWRRLLDHAGRTDPVRVVVRKECTPLRRARRWGPARWQVDFRPTAGRGFGGDFSVETRPDGRLPHPGDALEVWSNRPGSQLLVCRPADSCWWLGSAFDPVARA